MASHTLNRDLVLNRIFSELQSNTQWHGPEGVDYNAKALGLIELLEIVDCGSVGGHDRTNPNQRITGHELYDRFLTLLRKHPVSADAVKPICGIDTVMLARYYARLVNLRSDVCNGA